MIKENTQLFCAVDGGGTGCRVSLAWPDGTVIARATGGAANYTTDPALTAQNVLAAIGQALATIEGNAPALPDVVTHLGLAGIMSDTDADAMAAMLPFRHCTVSDDRVTSVIGALGGQDGVLLAVGTGSFAAVRRGAAIRFFGGWGLQVGDQASGAWLGRALLEHSLLAQEGIAPASDLTQAVMAHFGGFPRNISGYCASCGPAGFAGFAPMVVAAAQRDDPVGLLLMSRGAAYLNAILQAMQIEANWPICLIGGVGGAYERFLAPEFRAQIREPKGSALDGALQLALQGEAAQNPSRPR